MKKMKILTVIFITFLFSVCFLPSINAQNYWKGGIPGKETDWNTARNWSENKVPDWSEEVIISDVSTQSGCFPIINNSIPSIAHLKIYSNATLTILSKGNLLINGSVTYNSGVYLAGKIISEGEIIITNTALMEIENQGGQMIFENKRLAGN